MLICKSCGKIMKLKKFNASKDIFFCEDCKLEAIVNYKFKEICNRCHGWGVIQMAGYTYPKDETDIIDEKCIICDGIGYYDKGED